MPPRRRALPVTSKSTRNYGTIPSLKRESSNSRTRSNSVSHKQWNHSSKLNYGTITLNAHNSPNKPHVLQRMRTPSSHKTLPPDRGVVQNKQNMMLRFKNQYQPESRVFMHHGSVSVKCRYFESSGNLYVPLFSRMV
jgi:hypothetical protein